MRLLILLVLVLQFTLPVFAEAAQTDTGGVKDSEQGMPCHHDKKDHDKENDTKSQLPDCCGSVFSCMNGCLKYTGFYAPLSEPNVLPEPVAVFVDILPVGFYHPIPDRPPKQSS